MVAVSSVGYMIRIPWWAVITVCGATGAVLIIIGIFSRRR